MKRKWWLIPIGVVLILAIVLFTFWDAIAVRLMPNVVLSKAMVNTFASVEARLENSPLTVLAKGIDQNGNNAIDFQLDTSNVILGDVRYQMDVRTMGSPRKLNAKGTVSSGDGSLNLTVYADKDFAAVSSDGLLDGRFYGITYESFHEDIRSIPLLPILIGENTLNKWENSVAELQSAMGKSYDRQVFSETDFRTAIMGILALKPQVTGDTLSVSGRDMAVYKLSFSATGQQISSVAGDYLQYMSVEVLELVKRAANDPNSSISAVFYLLDDTVVKMNLGMNLEGESVQAELILGQDAARDPVKIALIQHSEEKLEKWSVDIKSEYDEAHYMETWSVIHIENGVQSRSIVDYTWDTVSGDMVLNVTKGAEERSAALNLKPAENGFRLATEQFEDLISIMSETPKTGNSSCVMLVSKGAEVTTPEYKNIDQWTGEDLLFLLERIGVLLGFQI